MPSPSNSALSFPPLKTASIWPNILTLQPRQQISPPASALQRPRLLTSFCSLLLALGTTCAQTWLPTRAPTNNWSSIACSADGTKLVASVGGPGGFIYTSADSGNSWLPSTGTSNSWSSVASSADATSMFAAAGLIYTSTNSGLTWRPTSAPAKNWTSVACSADGTKVFACCGPLYVSTNSGNTWTTNSTPAPGGIFIACSPAAGTLILGGVYLCYISTNSGATWSSNLFPNAYCWGGACSADGTRLIVVGDGPSSSAVYSSSDLGITWKTNNLGPFNQWHAAAASADGSRMFAASNHGLFSSADSGQTWITNSVPDLPWYSVGSSADGCKLAAVAYGAGIYQSQTTPAPQLAFYPSDNNNLTLSWLIPSRNFTLQQSTDLASTDWVTLTAAPVLDFTNLQDQITLPLSNTSAFYRLRSP